MICLYFQLSNIFRACPSNTCVIEEKDKIYSPAQEVGSVFYPKPLHKTGYDTRPVFNVGDFRAQEVGSQPSREISAFNITHWSSIKASAPTISPWMTLFFSTPMLPNVL